MQFRDVKITTAGLAMLARAAATKGKIIWTAAKTSTTNHDIKSDAECMALTALAGGASGYQGTVTSSVNNGGTCTIHAELSNAGVTGGGFARAFGIYAKIEGDADETLAVFGRNGGASASYMGPEANGFVRLFLDVAIDMRQHTLTSVSVDASNYAQAGALAVTNAAVEALQSNRWRVYRDCWDALENSEDGEWFSISNAKPRQAKIKSYAGLAIPYGGFFRIVNFAGPWVMCNIGNTVAISHVQDLLQANDGAVTPRAVVGTSGIDVNAGGAQLLWEHNGDFLVTYNGQTLWTSGANAPQGIRFHRSAAGLVGVAQHEPDTDGTPMVEVRIYSDITPGQDGEYTQRVVRINPKDYDFNFSTWKFASAAVLGKAMFFEGVGKYYSGGYLGQSDMLTFDATAITCAENAIITINNDEISINGQVVRETENPQTEEGDNVMAADCLAAKGGWRAENVILYRTISQGSQTWGQGNIKIPHDMQDYDTSEDGLTDQGNSSNGPSRSCIKNITLGFPSRQPCGFCVTNDNYFGFRASVIPWPGTYSRMVNRKGFLLPYLD